MLCVTICATEQGTSRRPRTEASLLVSLAASIPDRLGAPLLEKAFEHADPTLSATAAEALARMNGVEEFARLVR